MNTKSFTNCVSPNISISEAISRLKKHGDRCLVVVSKKNFLLGTLTDGDLRAAILKGVNLENSIHGLYNKRPKYVNKKNLEKSKIKKIFLKHQGVDLIPVLENKKVIDIITWEQVFSYDEYLKKVTIVIMAGGRGSRLLPFTHVLPKPLIPINDTPIINLIIKQFKKYNAKNFWISVNFKSNIIKTYLKTAKLNVKINYINEKIPLGTIGSLRSIMNKNISENLIVSNCDILIKSNLNNLYQYHLKKKLDLTLVVATKKYKIPYGSCKIGSNGILNKIDEKPEYEHFINTGLYIFNRKILKYIPKNEFCDLNNLVKTVKKYKKKVGVYPIDEQSWLDFGEWSEYQKALGKLV